MSVLVAVGAILWLATLLLLAQTAQNSDQFAVLHQWILLINAAGVVLLLVLIAGNLYRLIRDYRRHIAGSRLKARMVAIFAALAVAPVLLVYYFSYQFLTQGIDSWFHVEVEQGLENALDLSRVALDLRRREFLADTESMALDLGGWRDQDLVGEVQLLRRERGALEITVVGHNNRIIAWSSDRPADAVPSRPTEEVLLTIRQGRSYVSLDPVISEGGLKIITAAALPVRSPAEEQRVVHAVFPVGERLAQLADTVQQSFNQYGELAYLRQPLKYSFVLTLTLVLLLSLLAAVYGAFFSARRLVQPIQNLVAGTRSVAKGDFDTRLPMPARDEMGFLVNSFNDMTKRLAKAREEARSGQLAVENERTNLAVILARLSTGVVSLEPDLTLRTANQAAGAILGVDLESGVGRLLPEIAEGQPLLQQLADVAKTYLDAGQAEWREQIVLRGEVGRRVLMCACTPLPGEDGKSSGYVVVFDDITALLQAQRDAAWGEVARRLAHEIKNPLTPIQLSAERMRRKYLPSMDEAEAKVLDRATHTIVQQVEAMKEMVNAFGDYARAPDMEFTYFDLNQLITEVVDLYRSKEIGAQVKLNLDRGIPEVEADSGRVRQIIHNLLRNAVEALEGLEGSRVDVITRQVEEDEYTLAEIVVEDNGPGFHTDSVQQVFDPYVTTKPKGTGLGLAIVKKLVEEHGGRIQAENRAKGGARIKILLPIDEAARTALMPRVSRLSEARRERA